MSNLQSKRSTAFLSASLDLPADVRWGSLGTQDMVSVIFVDELLGDDAAGRCRFHGYA